MKEEERGKVTIHIMRETCSRAQVEESYLTENKDTVGKVEKRGRSTKNWKFRAYTEKV